jgi:hypothetical protein
MTINYSEDLKLIEEWLINPKADKYCTNIAD